MTNEVIIYNACIEAGITEQVHTFAHWKTLGFQVKRGEHAKLKVYIWKHSNRANANTDEESEPREYVFKKLAYFFGESQVEPATN